MTMFLEDGARIAVLGGGPAGSLFANFVLTFAARMELKLAVDIYEPRDFSKPAPLGCNMCGGIVSESMVQALALEGIHLPPTVVQRGIDSYVLHTGEETVRLDTPTRQKRIAAVHRGSGPRDARDFRWGSLDLHLLELARQKGANVIPTRVSDVAWVDGRPEVRTKGSAGVYDLLVGATGINSSAWDLFEKLGVGGTRPKTTKTYITELNLGEEKVSEYFGSSMHMFLLNIPRLDMAAIIPKGDFATVCLLGDEIDKALIDSFLGSPAVRGCFPEGWIPAEGLCHCSPKINVKEASRPFLDRVVLIGDAGVSRLYKDGIGSAYRTAKAAARTAVFSGVSAGDFERHYTPVCRSIATDNKFGLFMFFVIHYIKVLGPVLRGVVRMTEKEQRGPADARRMSLILWDMFTGSSPYRECFMRTLDLRFIARLLWECGAALTGRGRRKGGSVEYGSRMAG